MNLPATLGELRNHKTLSSLLQPRSVKDELRDNLIAKLQKREPLFPGIVGYEDTVVPQVINAVLSKHNFILLGLRGQAKTRLIRMLADLLDENLPYVAGCEIRDDPFAPICKSCKAAVAEHGDADLLSLRVAGHVGKCLLDDPVGGGAGLRVGVGAVEGETGEELGRHAPTATGVV